MLKRKAAPAARITGWQFLKKPRKSNSPRNSTFWKRKFARPNKIHLQTRALWNKQQSFMPALYGTKLVYAESTDAWDPGATGLYDYVYSGNSIYDPYSGVGGVEASGWPQLRNIYRNYCVIGSRITFEGHIDAGTVTDVKAVIFPSTSSVAFAARSISECPANASIISLSGDGAPRKGSNYCKTSTVFNLKNTDDLSLHGTGAANPATQWYWHVLILNSAVADVNVSGTITIEYYTILSDAQPPSNT